MNNSMVAHLWAHEQEESASGSNFFFEGTSIYSYGHHFEVGRIVKNKQGKKAYLINEDYYSVTTSKHQCYVRNAIPTCARVSIYEKGYKGYRNDVFDRPIEKDYRLSRPTKIKKIRKKSID